MQLSKSLRGRTAGGGAVEFHVEFSPWPSLDGIRALRHGTQAPVRESAATSHTMPHVTPGTCASCVWGVTWGYVRAAVEQPSRREAREARARARDGRGRAGGGRAHATRLAGLGALSGEQHHPPYTVVGQPRGPWEAPRFNKLFEDFRTDGHARGPALESRLNTRPTRSPRRSHSRNLALPLVTPRAARQLLYLVLVRSLWR